MNECESLALILLLSRQSGITRNGVLTVWISERTARLRLVAQIAAALVALAGCGHYRTDRSPGTIQVDIETSPTSTDPRFATDATSSRINELIFDSLVKTDRNGQFVGHLADRIERPSPTEIVFHLKHGVRFSDGRELTARDVIFTYDSIRAPESMSAKRAGIEELKSIDAPDDYTVVMTTAHPYAPALELATEGIVPAGTPLPSKGNAAAPIGSGPFQMVDYARDEAARLERNPYYPYPPGAATIDPLQDRSRPYRARARTGRGRLRFLGKQYRVRRVAVARHRTGFWKSARLPVLPTSTCPSTFVIPGCAIYACVAPLPMRSTAIQ